ncbi:MAG: methyltransferase domain-containing protein [Gemmatimonadota bacterium]|nr:methyltransferase domain-containing protein [Gemmatimonadota bacterium]
MSVGIAGDLLQSLRCPICRVALVHESEALRCSGCSRSFPIVLGIPDLRVYDDPLIPRVDDYRKGEKLQRAAESMTFAELVAYYWTLPTYPPTPDDLTARFIHHVLTDERRIAGWEEHLGSGDALLDVGCGAGVLVRLAHRRYRRAVGVDVGFRWLIVARRGLEEVGIAPRLVCACADHLPFDDGTFDTVTSVALLEHVPDPQLALSEFARVQMPAGRTIVWTSNRFSLAPEPHVRVWGVGFLPRRFMSGFVRWRRGLAYTGKTLLSRFELARMARRAGYRHAEFRLPSIVAQDLEQAGRLELMAVPAYDALRRIPWLRSPITAVFPALLAVLSRPASTGEGA